MFPIYIGIFILFLGLGYVAFLMFNDDEAKTEGPPAAESKTESLTTKDLINQLGLVRKDSKKKKNAAQETSKTPEQTGTAALKLNETESAGNEPAEDVSPDNAKKLDVLNKQLSDMQEKYERLDNLFQEKCALLNKTEQQLANELNNRKEFNKVKNLLEKELKDAKDRCRNLKIDATNAQMESQNHEKRIQQLEAMIRKNEQKLEESSGAAQTAQEINTAEHEKAAQLEEEIKKNEALIQDKNKSIGELVGFIKDFSAPAEAPETPDTAENSAKSGDTETAEPDQPSQYPGPEQGAKMEEQKPGETSLKDEQDESTGEQTPQDTPEPELPEKIDQTPPDESAAADQTPEIPTEQEDNAPDQVRDALPPDPEKEGTSVKKKEEAPEEPEADNPKPSLEPFLEFGKDLTVEGLPESAEETAPETIDEPSPKQDSDKEEGGDALSSLADITAVPDSPNELPPQADTEHPLESNGPDVSDEDSMGKPEDVSQQQEAEPEQEENAQPQPTDSSPDEKNSEHLGLKTLLDTIENPSPKISKEDLIAQEKSLNAEVEKELASHRGDAKDQETRMPKAKDDEVPSPDEEEPADNEKKGSGFLNLGKTNAGVHLVPDVMADQLEDEKKHLEDDSLENKNVDDEKTDDDSLIDSDSDDVAAKEQEQDDKNKD